MNEHEELLMHRAKIVTLMTAEAINEFCNEHSIDVETLTKFVLKYVCLPTLIECEFLSKYGWDKYSMLSDACRNMPTIAEISNALSEKTYDPDKVITVHKSSACGPTTSKPVNMIMEHIEDCPVCDTHNLVYRFPGFPECSNCKWYPVGMPYSEDEVQEAREAYRTKPSTSKQ